MPLATASAVVPRTASATRHKRKTLPRLRAMAPDALAPSLPATEARKRRPAQLGGQGIRDSPLLSTDAAARLMAAVISGQGGGSGMKTLHRDIASASMSGHSTAHHAVASPERSQI